MVFAGVMHIISPNFFLKIMPPYLPLHLELVYLSGVSLMFDELIYQLMTASNLPHSVVFDFGRTA